MTCFEERTSIWPAIGAPSLNKLNCANRKNLGPKTPLYTIQAIYVPANIRHP